MISLLIGIGVSLLVAGYNYAINRSAMKKAAREKSETVFDQPDIPVVDEQSSIPVIFGTVKLTGPNVVWWKKEPMQSINQTISHNQFKKYRYNQLGLHLVFCHGPIDGIEAIYRGEELRFSWVVDIVDTHVPVHTIVPQGKGRTAVLSEVPMRLYFGRDDHPQDPYLATALPFPINEITYRGVFSVVFGSATYDKKNHRGHLPVLVGEELPPISAVVSRGPLLGNGGANPAWIIEDILTNTVWGRGIDPAKIHRGSFDKAAAFLNEEDFGLCFVMSDQTPASEMLDEVCRHIDGAIQVNRQTGQVRLKLIREYGTQPPGFEPDPLPIDLDEDTIVNVDTYIRPSFGEMPTVQVVTFRRRGKGVGSTEGTGWWGEETENSSAFAHDTSGAIMRGKIDAPPIDYPGIPDSDLAVRVAQRDLRANATPRSTIELTVVGAVGQSVYAGDTIRVTYPKYGISGVVFRVTNVDIGPLTNGLVRLQAIEDVFSFDRASIVPQPPPAPTPALPAPTQFGFELPFWMRRQMSPGSAGTNYSTPHYSLAASEPAYAQDFVLYADGEEGALSDFAPVLTTTEPLLRQPFRLASESVVTYSGTYELDLNEDEESVWLIVSSSGHEFVKFTSDVFLPGSLIFYRGMLDTPPLEHPTGAKMYRVADRDWNLGVGSVDKDTGLSIDLQAVVRTLMGVQLDPALAPITTVTREDRATLPLPPADLFALDTTTNVQIDWKYRDVNSEPKRQNDPADAYPLLAKNTRYKLQIFGEDSTSTYRMFREVIISLPLNEPEQYYIYTHADERADAGFVFPTLSPYLEFFIWTIEDSKESLFATMYRLDR